MFGNKSTPERVVDILMPIEIWIPKVSIIIPVYHVEAYLEKCLLSVCGQTLEEIEIIVVNDGSPDRCHEIIDRFAREDSRIKTISQHNAGLSAARNAGHAVATGEYIGYVDSDDWVEPDMFEELYRLAKQQGADMAVCGRRDVRGDQYIVTSGNLKDECFSIYEMGIENFLLHKRNDLGVIVWNKIYRHRILKENDLCFEVNYDVFNEDILFNLYFQLHCDKVACTTKVLYNYLYRRPGSLVTSEKPGIESRIVNAAVCFHHYLIKQKRMHECKRLNALFMLEMVSNAFLHTYMANRRKYVALIHAYHEIAHKELYRELLTNVIKYKVPLLSKLRALLFLLKPFWLAALLTDLSYLIFRNPG
jgi:glycosyltransferase involved in cell wall biosynthesis